MFFIFEVSNDKILGQISAEKNLNKIKLIKDYNYIKINVRIILDPRKITSSPREKNLLRQENLFLM